VGDRRAQGAQADGGSWLERARRGLDAARIVAEAAPDSSVILVYGAARQACRPAGPPGPPPHYLRRPLRDRRSDPRPVRRQPAGFGGLRRRRNELEYPLYPTERASAAEAAEALKTADEIIDAIIRLLPNLGFF
jgi:hypothetical protein